MVVWLLIIMIGGFTTDDGKTYGAEMKTIESISSQVSCEQSATVIRNIPGVTAASCVPVRRVPVK